MTDVPADWQGILDPGEKILWQGRPLGGVVWRPAYLATVGFGAVFAGFALFWMVMAGQAGGGFWMFGLIHFSAGIAIAIGPPFWSAFRRARTWYTLTDRRAIIASDLPLTGRGLKSYPIDEDTAVEIEDGNPGSVYFANESRRTKNGHHIVRIGFERLADWKQPYQLIRRIQLQAPDT